MLIQIYSFSQLQKIPLFGTTTVYLFILLLLGHFGCFQLFISIYAVIRMIVSTSTHMSEGYFT